MSVPLRYVEPGDGSRPPGLLETIGHTPLLQLKRVGREFPHVSIYGKAEWLNPGGSVKDRAAIRMVLEGERSGSLRPGRTILDATSGNTGIAYAMIGSVRGYAVRLVLPGNASPERRRILKAYRADLIYTDPTDGMDGAVGEAARLARAEPNRYFYPDQYNNPANWKAHYDGTALEIWKQTGGGITHFVAGLGTSGTFVGTSRRLKILNPRIRCVSMEPKEPFHGLEGLKHMSSSRAPGIYDPSLAAFRLSVATEDAYRMVLRLMKEEGLLVGLSSGAAVAACLEVAARIPKGEPALIVTVFPDGGERYLSQRFWDEVEI